MSGPPGSDDHGPRRGSGPWAKEARRRPRMGMRNAVRACSRNYAVFSGRASRREFWWFFLFVQLGGIVAGLLDGLVFDTLGYSVTGREAPAGDADTNVSFFGAIWSLATFVPLLSAGWRRMHDSGRSGLHLLYPLIVMVGIGMYGAFAMGIPEGPVQDASMIVLIGAGLVFLISPLLVIYWLTRPSDPKRNRYGFPPAEVTP